MDDLLGDVREGEQFGAKPMSAAAAADSSSGGGGESSMSQLKRDLHGWRHVLIPLTRVLTWEQPWHPALLFFINSLLFLFVWYLDPSVLTTVSLVGLLLCITDYAVPVLSDSLLDQNSWSGDHERQYEIICEKLLLVKSYAQNSADGLQRMKVDKPKMYVAVMSISLVVMAYIGYCVNNLLLTYFIFTFMIMLPGLRHHGIIQKYCGQLPGLVSQLVNKATGKMKTS